MELLLQPPLPEPMELTFPDVEPGSYVLVEKNPAGYPGDVSDYDTTPDGDAGEGVVNADNKIPVTLEPAEDDNGNNFVDSNNGLISGTVKDDQGNVLPGVKVELLNPDKSVLKSTVTDSSGFYVFTEVEPGTYDIKETNPSGFPLNVSDYDASDDGDAADSDRTVDDLIGVTLKPGEEDTDNNFVDSNNGAITGTVKDDNGNPIAGVLIELQRIDGATATVVGTTTTDSNGAYDFSEVEPGTYKVVETNLATYPDNVSDYDTTPDSDPLDLSKIVDDVVDVKLNPGETDTGNDFVDSDNGKITGIVTDDKLIPLSSVLLTLKNSTGAVVSTTVTNGNGIYVFDNVEPGNYTVVETNPDEYPADLFDKDFTNDSDPTDSDTTVDNIIGVTVQPGETDDGNNFMDSNLGTISGSVKDDDDSPLAGVKITLNDSTGVVATTLTDAQGLYEFTGLVPGSYTVTETNPDGYKTDISDGDTSFDSDATDGVLTPDNTISVTLLPSETDANNDFVDSNKGTTTVATTVTAADGSYKFTGVVPGDYSVIEINPVGYPSNVRDGDTDPDGDIGDTDTTPDNSILVTVEPSEDDVGNDFVDSNNGSISGSVKDDNGDGIPGVTVTLLDSNDDVVGTATTISDGGYVFNDVEPGDYTVVETQPEGFPDSLSDKDNTPEDSDVFDTNQTVDNKIGVSLSPGESDDGNDFVDSNDGSISGFVKDDNGNPLKTVTIFLFKNNTVVATTKTDSVGFYIFNNVEPGDYDLVEINPPGFPSSLSDYDNSPDGDAGDSDTVVDDTISVTLLPSEDDTDNNFVDSDRGSISGSVKDEKGTPLVGVTVVLKLPDGTVIDTVTTSPSGGYTFNNVDPGDYVVEETNPDGYPKDVSDGDDLPDGDVDDSDKNPDNQIKVTLTEGENDDGNNFVDSNKGSISGTVKDDEGKPLAGVEIELQKPDGTVVATTTSGTNGVYTFPGVEPGSYVVVEKNPAGYPGDVSDYDTTPDGDAGEGVVNADNKIPVTLEPAEDDTGNNFVDSNNGLISGTVKDDQGNVLPGVKVELLNPDKSVLKSTVSDSNGFYVFTEVEPGAYDIKETNPSGFPLNVSDYDASNDGDATDSDRTVDNLIGVTLKPGEKDTDNNFVDSNNGAITGRVKDDNGNPIAGVPIELQLIDGATTTVVGTTTTDSSGSYSFVGVEPGTYKVVESNLPAYPDDVSDYDAIPDGDATDLNATVDNSVGVTVEAGETDAGNDFVDSDNGVISGSVTDDNGAPIPGTPITLKDSDGNVVLTTVTDSNGKYVFEDLEPGDYSIIESNLPEFPGDLSDYDTIPDGDTPDSNKTTDNVIGVTIKPGEKDLGNNFVDTNNGSVSGTVTDDDGKPLTGVPVQLLNPDGSVIASSTTDSNGVYIFTDVEPGTYSVKESNPVTHPLDVSDYDTSPDGDSTDTDTKVDNIIGVTVTPSEQDDGNDFVDSNKGSITGSVTDEQGEPLKDVTLTLTKPDGSTVTTVTDSNDGDVGDANTVPDNKIVVTITPGEKDGGNNFVDTLDSSAPSASPVTPVPTAPLTGSVSGSVTDDDGKPIKDVPLVLQTPTGEVIATTTTNDLGEYVFTNIPPGDYNIVESELPLYPVDVSDYDSTPDGDSTDADTKVDNIIGVTLKPQEVDGGNNFPDGSTVTTVTDSNGEYTFVGLPPGNYTLTETNPPGYSDVSDYDETPDGDAGDSNTVPDNKIVISVSPGEKDTGNNFIDTLESSAPSASPVTPVPTAPLTGSVTGSVTDDDGKPIKDVPLVLQTPTGEVIATTTTNDLGEYVFTNIAPGNYTVVEPVLPLFPVDVSDYDTAPDGDVPDADTKVDNIIGVTVKPQEVDRGNNFVDSDKGSITGSVTDEVGEPLKNVTLTLTKPDGSTVTTVTDSNGEYTFVGLPPGNYTLTETNPPGYSDVSDYDENPDGDADDGNTVPDNKIVITITPGEKDKGNNFIDTLDSSAPSASPVTPVPTAPLTGSVTGSVTDDDGKPIKDVPLVLQTPTGEVIATTTTNDLGEYVDYDTTPDGDVPDADTKVDNIIGVTVKPQEVDSGNNFVDSDKGSITGSVTDEVGEPLKNVTLTLTKPDGSTVTTVTDSNGEYTFVGLPPGNYTLTETNPPGYSDVSDYDEDPDGDDGDANTEPDNDCFPDPTCKLCAPSRSLDYCNVSESFPTLIQNRTVAVRSNPTAVATEGYWFHYLEDKVAAYLLTVEQEVSAPEIFCCVTSASELSSCFLYDVPPSVDGVVIKATNFHSSQGVYVLVPNPAGNGTINLLDNSIITYAEVVAELSLMQATKIIVEEFVGTSLPTEYKFHVVNGDVVAIDIITGRGADCPCYAVVDKNWNRLDQFGCFEPGGIGNVEANGCTSIDFITGRRRAGPVKKNLYICDDDSIPSDLDECLKQEMLTIALEAGARIGVYIRVDMFVVGGKVYVQEYTTNHMNGLRHCAAKFDPLTGCIDSCFIGRAWNAAGAPYGGVPTTVPSALTGFYALTPQQQCDLLIGVQPPVHDSTCTVGTAPPKPFP
ncbi:protein of unknown function DUF11 [Fragilaria crotonensis]|nr:protein of unknown function DUF11 [Fragilaria crotonensis]